jgi:DNA-binding SARP family transcriptional activator/predicted ATPase
MAKGNLALLGGFRLQRDTGEPIPLSTRKAGALLAYLALLPRRAHARAKLAALLWGDRSEGQARDSLRQALSLLRKALSGVDPHALLTHEDTISFEPTALNTDAILFERLAAEEGAETLEQAIKLYRGEFLEGFQIPAPEFDNWATTERQRFRELALGAMTKLMDHYLSIGAAERGIRIAVRLLAADPLQERVHRTLMELHSRQGRHGAALRQYRTCADLLAKELGIDPDATTKALRREILREWNQQRGPSGTGDPGVNSVCEIEKEPPATPRSPERRQVTVLVCELAGMNALAARLDPEEVQALIAAYQQCCMPIISRSGGAIGKLSGAEMLVHFGYPQAHEHDVECAARAGLSLVEAISTLDDGHAAPLHLHVGIATGPVVVGDLVGNGTDQHGIVGEAAQLAAILQMLAEPNAVVICPRTRFLLGDLFEYRDLGAAEVKGFAKPVSAWQVLREGTPDSRFDAFHSMTTLTPLIGREEELELLLRRWHQAKDGNGRVVLLSGEPGIGKSRLARAIREQLAGELHALLLYFCSPHHQASALFPFISQLGRAAGFGRDDPPERRLEKLETLLARQTDEVARDAAVLAELLSVPSGTRYPPRDVHPQKRKQATFATLLMQLASLAARQPVLVIFEDAQWIDPTSLELLDLIIDRIQHLPALLVATFRPEFQPSWVGRPHVTMHPLSRLGRREALEMVGRVAGGEALPQEAAEQIVARTDGVPLFVEELTKAVLEGNLFRSDDHRQVLAAPPPLAIPTTLHASLMARLDRLGSARRIAEVGAAIGRDFSHELVVAVADSPESELNEALKQLVASELVYRRGMPPDAVYTFKHALVQDAAYSTLLRGARRQLHARIANAVEERFPEVAVTQPELLAHHCAEGGLAERAVAYWFAAGERALRACANVEAIKHLSQGLQLLALLPDTPERQRQELRFQTALGPPLMAVRGWAAPEAMQAYHRADELTRLLGDRSERFKIVWGLWIFHAGRGDSRRALELSDELFRLADQEDDDDLRLEAHHSAWGTFTWLGEFATCWEHIKRGLTLYCPAKHAAHAFTYGGHDPGVCGMGLGAVNLWFLGYPDQAADHALRSVLLAEQIAHPASVAHALHFGLLCHQLRRDGATVRVWSERLAKLAAEQGLAHYATIAIVSRGWTLADQGQANSSLPELRRGRQGSADLGMRVLEPYYTTLLARAHLAAGEAPVALELLEETGRFVEESGIHYWDAELLRLKGKLLAHSSPCGAPQEVEACYGEALAVARRQQARSLELRAAMDLARLWRDQGKRTKASDLLAPIYNWFTEGLDSPALKAAKALLDQIA